LNFYATPPNIGPKMKQLPSESTQIRVDLIQLLRVSVSSLFFLVTFFSGVLADQAPMVMTAEPGQNVTIHESYNFSGVVRVRIIDRQTGGNASARFWSIKELWTKDRGLHTGSAEFAISGFRDELRAGHIRRPTLFLITAQGSVWNSISSGSISNICARFKLDCKLAVP